MLEPPLRARADAAFERALEAASSTSVLGGLHASIESAREQLDRPMTVAVVGRIKAGKSTMTNALLGETLAATGSLESTYNVNWFRYGEAPSIAVHYRDGRVEPRAFGELEALTRRSDATLSQLAGIDYVEVRTPSPLLRSFSLVDTPGLDSAHVADSDNTAQFLGLGSEEITERTQLEARNADAVLYLFSRGLTASGAAVVEEFSGETFGRATPLNAIGVLTKVDTNWKSCDDPVERGAQSAATLMKDPAAQRLFFTVRPVCALVAFGAATLGGADVNTLRALGRQPDAEVVRAVSNLRRFEAGAPANASLLARLGQCGIVLATRLIREGVAEPGALARELEHRSGMTSLRELIVSHFGNRALLIKLERVIAELRALCLRERNRVSGGDERAVLAVDDALDGLYVREHGFAELAVLRRHYDGALALDPPEVDELLRVTGESGTSVGERLGVEAGAAPGDLIAQAGRRVAYWSARAEFATQKPTRDAARTLRRSYERLAALAKAPAEPLAAPSV